MKIAINNRQKLLKINKRAVSGLTSFFIGKASDLLPERQWADISVVVADNELMSTVNKEFMNDNSPTDVLSFSLPPMPGESNLFSGEIFVNAVIAAGIGRGDTKKTARELALYIAHGCDHLMEQDDDTPSEMRRMRNRELKWLKDADALIENICTFAGKAGSNK